MDILIYGGGMLGQQVAHLIKNHYGHTYRIRGFVDDIQSPGTDVVDGLKTVGSLNNITTHEEYSPDKTSLVFAIGYSDMLSRRQAYEHVQAKGYPLLNLIHPKASVEKSVRLGEGVIILAGAIVDQFVVLGDVSYLHNGSIIGENCIIGVNNYFSAGTTLGGSVNVGDDNFFGINATIVNDITIGANNFINAGSLIYKPVANDLRMVEYREQREVAKK